MFAQRTWEEYLNVLQSLIVDRPTDSECVPDGYIAVDHVELDIQEMLELGKKAAISRKSTNNNVEEEVKSTGSRYVCTVGYLYRPYNNKQFSLIIHYKDD